MKTTVLFLFLALVNCLSINAQKCKIMLADYFENRVDFLIDIDSQTKFKSSQGIVTIKNTNQYNEFDFNLKFKNQNHYLRYETYLYRNKIPKWNEQHLTFSSIKLKDICLNAMNKYYVMIIPLPMIPQKPMEQKPIENN
ncbi:hypothetical protein [Emticicia fluvialis]|uniref:hypothetical protein n=1 Tax=Emticicia fluvialis TaxID=2974474 RepID=UPI0021650A17|nr:hypothetical protein [Emticicia fluvialis]